MKVKDGEGEAECDGDGPGADKTAALPVAIAVSGAQQTWQHGIGTEEAGHHVYFTPRGTDNTTFDKKTRPSIPIS